MTAINSIVSNGKAQKCPYTLGIGVFNGINHQQKMTPIIKKNTSLPVSRETCFQTLRPDQVDVIIHVCKGEHELLEDNLELGTMAFQIHPQEDKKEKIKIRFTYDRDNVVKVEATVMSTGEVHSKCFEDRNYNFKNEETLKRELKEDLNLDLARREKQHKESMRILARLAAVIAAVIVVSVLSTMWGIADKQDRGQDQPGQTIQVSLEYHRSIVVV